MIAQVAVGAAIASSVIWVFLAIKPPRSPRKSWGSPAGGSSVMNSSRIKLSDGRYLAYKEQGVSKEEAKYKIIVIHGFDSSKDLHIPVSQDLIKELQIYFLSFDRAGYGESDPNPKRSVTSEAYEIQELADLLELGSKFYIIGISIGAYAVWSCLKYIPHRLSGAALVVPMVNYWWPSLPSELSKAALGLRLVQDQRTLKIAHHAPWLFNWWLTQKWFHSLSLMEGNMASLCSQDIEIIKQLPSDGREKIRQQGIAESLSRDAIVSFGNWDFDPTDICNPFPNNEGSVHMWLGQKDGIIPLAVNRYLSQKLPWIQYHEVPDAGHFLFHNANFCEAILRELLAA